MLRMDDAKACPLGVASQNSEARHAEATRNVYRFSTTIVFASFQVYFVEEEK